MTRPTHIFVIVYLGIQLLLPLRGFVDDKLDSQSNFSWNMYSRNYSCRVKYQLRAKNGQLFTVDYKSFFKREQKAMKVMHRDSLPYFHEWLCERLSEERKKATLLGSVSCSINDGAYVTLVEKGTSICTEAYYGVLQE